MNEEKSSTISCGDYYKIICENKIYRVLFISYCIDNLGNWLTFIACMAIINDLNYSLYTSLYISLRMLPALLFTGIVLLRFLL
jgi:hypothetical protein